MSTRTSSPGPGAAATNGRRTVFIAVGVLAALVVVAIIVSLAVGGGDDDNASSASSDGAVAADSAAATGDDDAAPAAATDSPARIPQGEARQVSFAEGAGVALPRFDAALGADPAVGQAAPAITASYFDNTEVTVDPADGMPRVVIFLAHWCPHCQAEVTRLTEWMNVNGVPSDVQIVPVSTAVDNGAPNYPPSAWLLRENWPVPTLRDSQQSDLATAYGLSGFPFIVVVNRNGEVVMRNSGEITIAQWEAMLAAAAS